MILLTCHFWKSSHILWSSILRCSILKYQKHFPSHQKLELIAHVNITLTVKALICFKSALRKDPQKPSLRLRTHLKMMTCTFVYCLVIFFPLSWHKIQGCPFSPWAAQWYVRTRHGHFVMDKIYTLEITKRKLPCLVFDSYPLQVSVYLTQYVKWNQHYSL